MFVTSLYLLTCLMDLDDDSFADPDIDLITQMLEQMTLADKSTSSDPDVDLISQMLDQMTLTDKSTSADPDVDHITQMLDQMTLMDKSTSSDPGIDLITQMLEQMTLTDKSESEEWKEYFQQHCLEELMDVIEAREELTGSEKFAITLYTQDAYKAINLALRTGDRSSFGINHNIATLLSGMTKRGLPV
jgi:hypothetical protein